jgi:endonuclease III
LSKGRLALGADNEIRTKADAATPAATAPRGSSHSPSAMSEAERTDLVQVFNEMHGLLVGVGKNYCLKSQMRCEQCPLQKFLPEKS